MVNSTGLVSASAPIAFTIGGLLYGLPQVIRARRVFSVWLLGHTCKFITAS